MAKFLPFVVESSTPLHTFQSLISRSKGINNITIASIFYAILDKGINEIRERAKTYPDNIATERLYEELMDDYPNHKIKTSDFNKIMNIKNEMEVTDSIPDRLKDYETVDALIFLMVVTLVNLYEDYTDLPLYKLFNGEAEKLETNLKETGLFSNDGMNAYFATKASLIGYIHFYGCIYQESVPVIHAHLNSNAGESDES